MSNRKTTHAISIIQRLHMRHFFLSAKCTWAHSQRYVDMGHDTSDMLQNFEAFTSSWWLKTESLFEGRTCWCWVKSSTLLACNCSTLACEVLRLLRCLLSCHSLESFTKIAKVVTTNLIATKLRIFVSNCHCSFKPPKWHPMAAWLTSPNRRIPINFSPETILLNTSFQIRKLAEHITEFFSDLFINATSFEGVTG